LNELTHAPFALESQDRLTQVPSAGILRVDVNLPPRYHHIPVSNMSPFSIVLIIGDTVALRR